MRNVLLNDFADIAICCITTNHNNNEGNKSCIEGGFSSWIERRVGFSMYS